MVDPVSASVMAIGSMGATALGGILQAQGQTKVGEAQSRMYSYQAATAMLNKDIALQNATYSRRVGEVMAQKKGMEVRANLGQATAVQAGKGLDINRGTPARVRESIHDIGLHDVSLIRGDATRRAYGHEVEAIQAETQSGLYKMASTNAKEAAALQAEGTLLGTATSVASKWLQFSSTFGNPFSTTEPTRTAFSSAAP